jgi:hypothetical protein
VKVATVTGASNVGRCRASRASWMTCDALVLWPQERAARSAPGRRRSDAPRRARWAAVPRWT